MTRHVVVAGGTGEVGKQLLALLAARPDLSVRALVRRPGSALAAPNIQEVPFDYEEASAYGPLFAQPCDLLLIALGTRKAVPIHVEATIFALPRIYLNGGSRGFLVEVDPRDLERVLKVNRVSVAIP